MFMSIRAAVWAAACLLVAAVTPLRAADTMPPAVPPASAPRPADEGDAEMKALRRQVDDLRAEVERLKRRDAAGGVPAGDLKDAEERLDAVESKLKDLERRQAQTTSANPLTVLNPAVTVVGNFLWRLDDRKAYADSGERIDDKANLREVELDLRAAIDPYADGVCIIALGSEVPGQYEADVEEFLINVKSLPLSFWETPPLGTKIKIGRMRTEFGMNNRLHLHDLPQSDRPLCVEAFLGEEGHIANGLSLTSFLPSPGDTALELTLQALQGGGAPVALDRDHFAYLANLHLYVPLADEHEVNVGLIGFYGTNNDCARSRVGSLDAFYRWRPARQGDSWSFVLGGQLFASRYEFREDLGSGITGPVESTRPLGYTVWAQYQLSKPLYAGVRWDLTDQLTDDTIQRKRITPYLSYYLSEFFRVRASYEHLWSDLPAEDRRNTFLLELNVVFGSHPPEPFWVNK
jgi:hypothetical protein